MITSTAVGKFWAVSLDCADAPALARFWAAMTNGSLAYEGENFSGVELDNGVWIGAYAVPDYVPPVWPDGGERGKQFHLDITVDDLDVAERAATELGATKAEHQANPDGFRVMFDPAGHPFCLTVAVA